MTVVRICDVGLGTMAPVTAGAVRSAAWVRDVNVEVRRLLPGVVSFLFEVILFLIPLSTVSNDGSRGSTF